MLKDSRRSRHPRRWLIIGTAVSAVAGTAFLSTPASAWGPGDSTSLISQSSAGTQANAGSVLLAVSGNGRYVAFTSYANNLVPHDTNNTQEVFVRDRQTGKTQVASIAPNGSRLTDAFEAAMSSNGRYIVSIGSGNAYLRDMTTGRTRLVSVDKNGQKLDMIAHATVTADGQKVAFERSGFTASETPISQVWMWTAASGHATLMRTRAEHPELSANGTYLAYQDAWWMAPIQLHAINLVQHTETLVSTGAKGPADIGSSLVGISADGRYVGFTSYANNLAGPNPNASTEIFVRDLVGRTTIRVSVSSTGTPANKSSYGGWLSADGHYVGYWSDASNLVPGDTNGQADVFVHSLRSGNTYRASLSSRGGQLSAASYGGMISADGHHVGFEANADGVTTGDANGQEDIFLRNAATIG